MIGCSESLELDSQTDQLKVELRQLAREQRNSQLAFVTRQDLREVETDEDTFFVAIRAPVGSTLNVPADLEGSRDPLASSTPKYELFVKSSGGPMTVFLMSEDEVEPAVATKPSSDHWQAGDYFSLSHNESLSDLYEP
jgi:hypothetical protein